MPSPPTTFRLDVAAGVDSSTALFDAALADPVIVGLCDQLLATQSLDGSWDESIPATALAVESLLEAGLPTKSARLHLALDWLWHRAADPAVVEPNEDDSLRVAEIVFAFGAGTNSAQRKRLREAIKDLREIQNADGGWFLESADDAAHLDYYDRSCPEQTGRVLTLLGRSGLGTSDWTMIGALDFVASSQEADSGWPGRFGADHFRGTWRVICGLRSIGMEPDDAMIRRAVHWLERMRNPDGSWGKPAAVAPTAWALLTLVEAGEDRGDLVQAGVRWLDKQTVELTADVAWSLLALSRCRRAAGPWAH